MILKEQLLGLSGQAPYGDKLKDEAPGLVVITLEVEVEDLPQLDQEESLGQVATEVQEATTMALGTLTVMASLAISNSWSLL